ncbi:MAG: DNA mismatch repair protein MutS [Deltaproteobacteria bacterium]|nr:DNA mismatch repair protein MutS [Deltaproteobacteria bacterium]
MTPKLTPMLEQYLEIKERHKDYILLYHLGDFFEMFFEDALVASRVLEITLTSRNKGAADQIPMCGVPVQAAPGYIARLIERGYKVALCEQMEDPLQAKGIVRRAVTRLITPGSFLEGPEPGNRYLLSLAARGGRIGLATADLSTGEFRVTEVQDPGKAWEEVGRIQPAEILLPRSLQEPAPDQEWLRALAAYFCTYGADTLFDLGRAETLLQEHYQVHSLAGFGLTENPEGLRAAGALLAYLKETQQGDLPHLKTPAVYTLSETMILSESAQRHLELTRTLYRGTRQGSLISVLDQTRTAMGSRKLRQWLTYPLLDLNRIQERQDRVEALVEDPPLRRQVRELLQPVYDIERLTAKTCLNQATPRDLVALKNSLRPLAALREALLQSSFPGLREAGEKLETLEDVAEILHRALLDEPSLTIRDKEARLIRRGYHLTLDQYLQVSREGKEWISALEAKERKRTGISSLKVGYNRVFGYYIEVSKTNLHLVPEDFQRRQTLANGERFLTPELQEYETLVLEAEDQRWQLEVQLFQELRQQIGRENQRLQRAADQVSELDVLASLAQVAQENHYCKPLLREGDALIIQEGRHPVIEKHLPAQHFVPNSLALDNEERQMIIITGPNMAGKSTILRQTALIVLMAQMGSLVPADAAEIGLVDQIFTRVGASDDLSQGQSTFMVEMQETARILHQATERSLVLLDEIGRGTSTYDGLSIAWAVAEYLHDWRGKGVKTLFATHYHELTDLTQTKKKVKNVHVAVKEFNNQILFLRKLQEGGTSRSYGIQVARLAGLPEAVIARAREVLENLEKGELDPWGIPTLARTAQGPEGKIPAQMEIFPRPESLLEARIRNLVLDHLTPFQALLVLKELKESLS